MADKYWVGGSGNWSDNTNHWSTSSGGAPGAATPTSSDSVFIDANSSVGALTISMDVNADCDDFNWSNGNVSGSFISFFTNSNKTFNIYGSIIFTDGPNVGSGNDHWLAGPNSGTIIMQSPSAGETITMKGNNIPSSFRFSGGGDWTLQDTLKVQSLPIRIEAGTLITNNKAVNAASFNQDGASTVTAGSSTITLTGSSNAWFYQSGTFNADTSTIVLSAGSADFKGGGATYYNVSFTGTPTTVTGANTFNSLTVAAGKRVNFVISTIQTITTLNAIGTAVNHILFRSTVAGTQASLCVTNWNIAYVDVQDINASCASVTDCTGTNSGNNSGWDFCTGRAFLLTQI